MGRRFWPPRAGGTGGDKAGSVRLASAGSQQSSTEVITSGAEAITVGRERLGLISEYLVGEIHRA